MANDEHLRKAFSYFDKGGNGYIEALELQEALAEDGAADSKDVANDILQEVDMDKVLVLSLIEQIRQLLHLLLPHMPWVSYLSFFDCRMEKLATKNLWQWWKQVQIGGRLLDIIQEADLIVSASD